MHPENCKCDRCKKARIDHKKMASLKEESVELPETTFPANVPQQSGGLTKREYAAVHILAGLVANYKTLLGSVDETSNEAIRYADALFAELEKGEGA